MYQIKKFKAWEVHQARYFWILPRMHERARSLLNRMKKLTSSEINIRAKSVDVVMTASCWKGSRQNKLCISF